MYLQALYTPKWWPIELKWAMSKNYVVASEQQVLRTRDSNAFQRLTAKVADQLRDRWFKPYPKRPKMWKLFRHCEGEMNKALEEYAVGEEFQKFWQDAGRVGRPMREPCTSCLISPPKKS